MDEHDLLALADANLAQAMIAHARWDARGEAVFFGDLLTVASGHRFPAGFFNAAIFLGPPPDAARARSLLENAASFFSLRERGYSVYTRAHADGVMADLLKAEGYAPMWPSPGMVLEAQVAEPPLPEGVRIERLNAGARLADFVRVAAPAYAAVQLPEGITARIFGDAARVLTPDSALFVAYAGDEPAACVMYLLSHGIAGLYWVGTRPEFRRRGLADAVTRRASNAAFEAGARVVILQASEQGEPVYTRIGFRIFTRYPWFVRTRSGR